MKILIVDDSPVNLKLLRVMLKGEGFTVVEAPDGAEALAVLKRGGVDAVISDILMPRMDGYRLCQEVRHSEQWRDLPFIFHTATYTSPADEKLCHDVGGDQYLRKPAPKAALLAALRDALDAAREHRRPHARLPSQTEVMKEYSERLVCKLEEKNRELEQARTELQKANQELEARVQQRTAELLAANEELESFAHSVSHDLRAPITHIKGFIDIVLRNSASQLDEASLRNLHIVRDAAGKMRELIDALLELSIVSQTELHRRTVDLSALAGEVLPVIRQHDPDRSAQIKIAPGIKVTGDRRLLRVALVNLLDNAWKYTRKQSEARIEFGKITGKDGETFFVRDNGAGFDMAYAGKLFRPFQRLHPVSEFEGTGIGLATVHRIIQRHNGRVWAEGAEHRGATFYFTLGSGISG